MDGVSGGTGMVHGVAEVRTPLASRYMTQFCKHFEHRLPATYDAAGGSIQFGIGDCALRAADGVLRLEVAAADAAALATLQDVVARHLIRFAFREALMVVWRAA